MSEFDLQVFKSGVWDLCSFRSLFLNSLDWILV